MCMHIGVLKLVKAAEVSVLTLFQLSVFSDVRVVENDDESAEAHLLKPVLPVIMM